MAEKQAGKPIGLVADGRIGDNVYEVKYAEAKKEIADLREELDYYWNSGSDWREAMRKTLDVLFDGRERFGSGNVFCKKRGAAKFRFEHRNYERKIAYWHL